MREAISDVCAGAGLSLGVCGFITCAWDIHVGMVMLLVALVSIIVSIWLD